MGAAIFCFGWLSSAVLYRAVSRFLATAFERKYHPDNRKTRSYHCSRQLFIQGHGSGNLSIRLVPIQERKHRALRPQKPLRLIREGEVGEVGNVCIRHLLVTLSPPEWFCIKVGSCVSHFAVSLTVWAQSQDSVHNPHFLKRKDRWSGSNRGPSTYQPGAFTARPHRLTPNSGLDGMPL